MYSFCATQHGHTGAIYMVNTHIYMCSEALAYMFVHIYVYFVQTTASYTAAFFPATPCTVQYTVH